MRRSLFLYLPLLVLTISPLFALQNGDISIDSRVDKSVITIGDLVHYTVEVKRAREIEVTMPELGANLGAFELRDYGLHDPVTEGEMVIERVDYTISTFDVGEFKIPALSFFYTLPGDSTRKELKTQEISIVVESLKPSEAGDIRDIKQPLSFPRDYRKYIIWGSVAFAFLLLMLVSIYIWRRQKAGKGILPQKVEPPRPAHDIALEALSRLKASSLLTDGKIKQYYIELSEIIRRYIEGRYFIIALEMTTFELVEELRMAEIEEENIVMIHDFLNRCDLVKFAKYKPQAEQHTETLDSAFALVEQTKVLYEIPLEDQSSSEIATTSELTPIAEKVQEPTEK